MKKILSLILIFAIVCSFAGCGDRGQTEGTTPTEPPATVLSLLQSTLDTLSNFTSVDAHLEQSMSCGNWYSIDVNLDIKNHVETDSAYMEGNMSGKVIGFDFDNDYEIYHIKNDNKYLIYQLTTNDEWSAYDWKYSEKEFNSFVYLDLFKILIESLLPNATTYPDAWTLDETDETCYKIVGKVRKANDLFKNVGVNDMSVIVESLGDYDFDIIDLNIVLYISKDTKQIREIKGNVLRVIDVDENGVETEYSSPLSFDVIYNSFDTLEPIVVPQAVLDSAVLEDSDDADDKHDGISDLEIPFDEATTMYIDGMPFKLGATLEELEHLIIGSAQGISTVEPYDRAYVTMHMLDADNIPTGESFIVYIENNTDEKVSAKQCLVIGISVDAEDMPTSYKRIVFFRLYGIDTSVDDILNAIGTDYTYGITYNNHRVYRWETVSPTLEIEIAADDDVVNYIKIILVDDDD